MIRHHILTALRHFSRHRLLTAINVFCIAIGLVCFIASAGTVQYLRGSDRHWNNSERIVVITQRLRSAERGFDTGVLPGTSPPVAKYLRTDMPALEAVARIEDMDDDVALAVDNGTKVSARIAGAESDFLRIFDLQFDSSAGVNALESPGSIAISSALAARLFGTGAAVGKTILLDNSTEVTVTGVFRPIPQPSHLGSSVDSVVRFDALISMDVLGDLTRQARGRSRDEETEENQWGSLPFLTYALLPNTRSGRIQLDVVLQGFAARHIPPSRLQSVRYDFGTMPVSSILVSDLESSLTRGTGFSITSGLLLLGFLVLLMSCLNYANSVSAQLFAKRREVAVQKVLGAQRSDVFLQPVIEAVFLCLVATIVALTALAAVLSSLKGIAPDLVTRIQADSIARLPYLLALVTAVGVAAGIYPGLVMARVHPAEFLRAAKTVAGHSHAARIFVGLQFCAASLLLIVAFYVYAQNQQMRRAAMAPETDPIVIVTNDLRNAKVDFRGLQTELLRIPQIKAVATLNELPWISSFGTVVLGREVGGLYHEVQPIFHIVSEGFLSALDIPLLAGRSFDPAFGDDTMPGGDFRAFDKGRAYSVVVDRSAARALGYDNPESAVDETIEIPFSRVGLGKDQPVRIIGVAESRPLTATAPAAGISSALYVQMPPGVGYPIIRIDKNEPATALAAIDAVWNRLAPNFPVNRRFMDELFEQSYVIYDRIGKFATLLMSAALIVAFLGMVGMASFVAARRTHEIGVRKSMGASSASIILMLVRDFSLPVLVASLAAWPFAYMASQVYLEPFLQKVPITPLPFLLSLLAILTVAVVAVSGQTLRAAHLNPATVLRNE
jgi:putative ABC transport system permease protein